MVMRAAETDRDTLVDEVEAVFDVDLDITVDLPIQVMVPPPIPSSITLAPVAYAPADATDEAVVATFRQRDLSPRVTRGLFVAIAGTIVGVFVGLAAATEP